MSRRSLGIFIIGLNFIKFVFTISNIEVKNESCVFLIDIIVKDTKILKSYGQTVSKTSDL